MKTATAAVGNSAVKAENEACDGGYEQLMSDILHDLSQPLSTVTCLLEVNLLLSRPAKQLRHDAKIALQQVHFIVHLFRDLRELVEAGQPEQDQEVVSLETSLREVVADLLPMAKSANATLSLSSSSDCPVNLQAGRLRQALFHLLEFALGCAAPGAELQITAGADGVAARVTVEISSRLNARPGHGTGVSAGSKAESAERKRRELKQRLGLAVARRIFESANGNLQVNNSGEPDRLEARLPLAWLPA